MLPLVSRGWARLLEGPSPAWEEIIIARHAIDDALNVQTMEMLPNLPAMEAWLSRRAGAVRNLRVLCFEGRPGCGPPCGPLLPARVLAAALGTHVHQLRVLDIELAAIALSSADLDALLERASNLEQLSLDFRGVSASWDDLGAALMQTLSRLPALQSLDICTPGMFESAWDSQPTVVEFA